MNILVFAIVIVIAAFLLCYAVDQGQVQPPLNPILKVLIILVAVFMILGRAGMV